MGIGVGEFAPHECTATDEEGTIRVCDPRAWLLWLWAIHHSVAYRTHPRGFEAWGHPKGDPPTWEHYVVKYNPMKAVEK